MRHDLAGFLKPARLGNERRELLSLSQGDVGSGLQQQLADFVDCQVLGIYFHVVEHSHTSHLLQSAVAVATFQIRPFQQPCWTVCKLFHLGNSGKVRPLCRIDRTHA